MEDERKNERKSESLRRKAEERFSSSQSDMPAIWTEETRKLIQELNSYQAELETQNEELQKLSHNLEMAWAKYHELYDFAPVPYLTVDKEGVVLEVNIATTRLLGIDRADLIGKYISSFVAPDFHNLYKSCFLSAAGSNANIVCNLQLVREDGTVLYVQMEILAINPMLQEGLQRWIVITDVTEIKKTEEMLKRRERELTSLLENMARGFVHFKVLFDERGQPEDLLYVRINNSFEKLTGLKRDEVVGRKFTEVWPNVNELEFDWIGKLGNVGITGQNSLYEQFFVPLGKWYSISAYCPEKGFCAATFADITKYKE